MVLSRIDYIIKGYDWLCVTDRRDKTNKAINKICKIVGHKGSYHLNLWIESKLIDRV